jgi:hypothetical protein
MVLACVSVMYGGAQVSSAGSAGGTAAAAAGNERMGVAGPPPGESGGPESSPEAAAEAPVDLTGTAPGEEQPQILPAPAPAIAPGSEPVVAGETSTLPVDDDPSQPPAAGGEPVDPEPPVVDDGVTLIDDGSSPWQSWSFDGFWQVDRPLADPGVLDQPALDGVTVYATSARICVLWSCATYWVPRYTSASLSNTAGIQGDAMPDRPAWVSATNRAIWAPSVVELNGGYTMYFAATAGTGPNLGLKCIGAATSLTPAGPFVAEAAPLACGPTGYWAIDPYVLADDGHLYMLWREDDATHVLGKIVGAELSPDGLSLATAPVTLMEGVHTWEDSDPIASRPPPTGKTAEPGARSYPPYAIEEARTASVSGGAGAGAVDGDGPIGPIENPAIVRHPDTGEWLLTWSANAWETQNYATGLATCEGPLGPCTRMSTDTPWLRTSTDASISTTATFGGAGGMSFCHGPDGMLYAFFHAYRDAGDATTASRITWVYRVEPDIEGYHLYEY